MRTLRLATEVLVIAVVLLAWRSLDKRLAARQLAQPVASAEDRVETPHLAAGESDERRSGLVAGLADASLQTSVEATLEAEISLVPLSAEDGFTHVTLETADDGVYVDVTLAPEASCGAGDLDVILADAARGTSKNILLSLETLDGAEGEAGPAMTLSRGVDLAELQSGLTHRFTLPRGAALKTWGLFLCHDESFSGSCRGKPLVALDAILEEAQYQAMIAREGLTSTKPRRDHVYAFQPLLVAGSRLTYVDAAPGTKGPFRVLRTALDEAMVDDMEHAVTTLRSRVLESGRSGVTLPLPRHHEDLCAVIAAEDGVH